MIKVINKAASGYKRYSVSKLLLPLVLMLLFLCNPAEAKAALTAREVAQKAAALVGDKRGVVATFTLTGNGRTTKGTVKTSGSKFTVQLPEASAWYNGKILYSYNPRVNETTMLTPTSQDLVEANPLLYINNASAYNFSFSPVKRNGKYVVDLTPVKKNTGIKKITLTVNASTFHPEKISVTAGGGTSVITVTSFKTGVAISSSEFEYPRSKYPKTEIIDLR
ncbi:MAG: hypothetical protein K2M10_08520 [Muribaculaceae bacterium]|nr:hypothetical protein [Muribaculaceae bacterium]